MVLVGAVREPTKQDVSFARRCWPETRTYQTCQRFGVIRTAVE